MTTLSPMIRPLPDAASHLVLLLERHSEAFPQLERELRQQRALAQTVAEHLQRGERALAAWRVALSRRWECEVHAQRVYSRVQRQLGDYLGPDPLYAQLIAPAHQPSASTPSDLLHELRRLTASLELLVPRPPFADEAADQLQAAAQRLAWSIEETTRCEAERRGVLTEQRIAINLYNQAYDRARCLLARCVGDPSLLLTPGPAPAPAYADGDRL